MEQVTGDITRRKAGVILHQVNCHGVMSSGVALAIKNVYPQVFAEYRQRCETTVRISRLLGTIQPVSVSERLTIINVFGQIDYGSNKLHTDYTALDFALKNVSKLLPVLGMTQTDISIHHPLIGCGTGGGDWDVVKRLIIKHLGDDTFLWTLK